MYLGQIPKQRISMLLEVWVDHPPGIMHSIHFIYSVEYMHMNE